MAFSDPITANDNAAVLQTFTQTGMLQNGSDWVENDATAASTRRLVLRHSNAGASVAKGASPIRRHLQQWTHEKYNATLGKTEKLTFNLTVTQDPGASFTSTDIYDLLAFVKNFSTTGNLDKMLRNES